jgi:hypothetical protein
MLQRRNECHKHTSYKHKEHTNSQRKETCAGKEHSGKLFHRLRCQDAKASATRLAYKACFKGSVESNMEPALGKRRGDENLINRTL